MLAEWVTDSVFNEVAALLAMAAATGFVGPMLRQPLIVSFIAVGIIAGPSALEIVQSDEPIDLLAELGVAILLFLVGIKLDVELIRALGPVSLATGLGQVRLHLRDRLRDLSRAWHGCRRQPSRWR